VVVALPSTTPWPVHKSSTDDLGLYTLQSEWMGKSKALRAKDQDPRTGWSPKTILPRAKSKPDNIVAMSRRDSALEAFRHNPTDGSLAPLADRPSTKPNVRTCGSSRTEQDYYRNDESSVG